ncbi:hypothetical protein [Microbacterium sp. SORGH_AS_0888]|uniref:hypothetical protein n=1 Tax=Microbacterium sp. SORGH_AS_0888 TaxID=3041791 RepID=UPI002781427B|nr:hypothetical protein [Microbacterium sp. SORGH_AS_0888]MDQ1130810.1 hypothetical protein [Microbacterium sp. SORGH_AS_0888]
MEIAITDSRRGQETQSDREALVTTALAILDCRPGRRQGHDRRRRRTVNAYEILVSEQTMGRSDRALDHGSTVIRSAPA